MTVDFGQILFLKVPSPVCDANVSEATRNFPKQAYTTFARMIKQVLLNLVSSLHNQLLAKIYTFLKNVSTSHYPLSNGDK